MLSEELRKCRIISRELPGENSVPHVLQVRILAFRLRMLPLSSFILNKIILLTEVITI
jgi:hypothetical protein